MWLYVWIIFAVQVVDAFDPSLIDLVFASNQTHLRKEVSTSPHFPHSVELGFLSSIAKKAFAFTAIGNKNSLATFPQTFTSGFVRLDNNDSRTGEFVQASVFELDVCSRYRKPIAKSFMAPACCPKVKGIKFRNLVLESETAATMTFDYYATAKCPGLPITARTIGFPASGATQPTSTPVGLRFSTRHVETRSEALRLIPADSSGFVIS